MTNSILQGKKLTSLLTLTNLVGDEKLYVVDGAGASRQANISALISLIQTIGTGYLSAGANLADLTNPADARNNLGLGTMSQQNANNVALGGGNINNTPIGNLAPAYGKFTNLVVTTSLIIPAGSITVASIAGNIPNTKLENSTINVSLANGLVGDAVVELGGTLSLSIEQVDGGDF